jgi:hypothetical protein
VRDIDGFPTTVYIACNAEGDVLYVGVTVDFDARMAFHRPNSKWWPLKAYIEREEYPNRTAALDREIELIRQFDPPFNKAGKVDELGNASGSRADSPIRKRWPGLTIRERGIARDARIVELFEQGVLVRHIAKDVLLTSSDTDAAIRRLRRAGRIHARRMPAKFYASS